MESFFKLNVEQRETTGNSAARSLRRNGKVPANYYYKGESNQNLSIDKKTCLLYTSPSPRDVEESRMPSSA